MKHRAKHVSVAGALLATGSALGLSPLGPTSIVTDDGAISPRDPDVAVAEGGRAVVVWEDDRASSPGSLVFARFVDGNGLPVGEPLTLAGPSRGDETEPRVAMAPDGLGIAVWTGFDDDEEGVFGRRFVWPGQLLGREIPVNVDTEHEQSAPDVAIDDRGWFFVAWQSWVGGGLSYDVLGRPFLRSGAQAGAPEVLDTFHYFDQLGPSVALSDSGRLVVGWSYRDELDGATLFSIFDRAWTSGEEIEVDAVGDPRPPVVAVGEGGAILVVWESRRDLCGWGEDGIFAQRLDPEGREEGSALRLGAGHAPTVASRPGGGFAVAWEEVLPDGRRQLLALEVPALGAPRRGARVLWRGRTEGSLAPEIGIDRNGTGLVVWRGPGDTQAPAILARRVTVDR